MAPRQRFGLFDDVGVGKTAQVVRALDIMHYDRNWITCKATARKHWLDEFKKFSSRYRRICIGKSIHDFYAWQKGHFDTLITSYDHATRWMPYFRQSPDVLDAVVFDEGQELRNAETQRAKQLIGRDSDGNNSAVQWCAAMWWVTGTPNWNSPTDIYTWLRSSRFINMPRDEFLETCYDSRSTTYGARYTAKPHMVKDLRALIANNSIRRTLEGTGHQLPPLLSEIYPIEGDAQPVRDLIAAHPGIDEIIRQALEEGRSISNLDTDHVATLRRLIGEAKSIPYAAMLLDELHNGLDKMVVFGMHRLALQFGNDYMHAHGIASAIINGSTSTKQDDANIARFQTDPTMRVLWCNITSAGTSLTMTASCHIDMLESAWTDKANYQAIRRVYRMTQTRGTRARFITLADSFDEVVNEIVARKAEATAVLDTAHS